MLINYIEKMDKSLYSFFVVYQHEPVTICKEKMEQAGCETIRITARSENLIRSLVDTHGVIRKYKPDIVHSNMNLMNFIPNYYAKKEKVKVRISHSHIAEKNKNVIYQLFARFCKKSIIRTSNVFLACGNDAAEYLHGCDIKSTIIHNAVNITQFHNTSAILDSLKEYQDCFVIGHVGRFTEQKNHRRLVDIFNVYVQKHHNAILALAGTGELESDILDYVEENKLQNKVIFLGAIKEMDKFYSSIDFLLLPSIYEGFPVVSLEVQAAGVRSIFSDAIDPQVKITSLLTLLSLKKTDQEWVEAIDRQLKQYIDEDYIKKIQNAGYDIDVEADKLNVIYCKSVSEV